MTIIIIRIIITITRIILIIIIIFYIRLGLLLFLLLLLLFSRLRLRIINLGIQEYQSGKAITLQTLMNVYTKGKVLSSVNTAFIFLVSVLGALVTGGLLRKERTARKQEHNTHLCLK